ncbi:MAG: toll/interleukin-1 receptor domain-containing protein [Fimbriimonas sp.]
MSVKIFVSHKHSDGEIAKALSEYLQAALEIGEDEIRCTSQPRQGLGWSEAIPTQLRDDVGQSVCLVALLTEDSLSSTWIKFELGAAWVTKKTIIPILGPELELGDERLGPIGDQRCIAIGRADSDAQIVDSVHALARELGVPHRETPESERLRAAFIESFRLYGNIGASFEGAEVEIVSPGPDEVRTGQFEVKVRCLGLPPGAHVWLSIKGPDLFWPKVALPLDGDRIHDGVHSVTIIEGGQVGGEILKLALIGVGTSGNNRLQKWHDRGPIEGYYGLKSTDIPGFTLL